MIKPTRLSRVPAIIRGLRRKAAARATKKKLSAAFVWLAFALGGEARARTAVKFQTKFFAFRNSQLRTRLVDKSPGNSDSDFMSGVRSS
jgi:hypothetical protein